MRLIPALVMVLGLAACGAAVSPEGGVANYDALRQAQANCAAKGGQLVLKSGGDPEDIQDYACERK